MTQGRLVVLGIDPGTRVTGFGLVAEQSGQISLVDTGTIRTPLKEDMAVRLKVIFEGLAELVRRHAPAEAAMENVFVSKNVASALKLGQARGAAMCAVALAGIPLASYEPTKVKQNLVGTGRAPKDQVAYMVAHALGLKKADCQGLAEDATDALAVAICHLNQRRLKRLTEAAS